AEGGWIMFVHTVFFWLKTGVGEDARAQLVRDCREYLGTIPSVKNLLVGIPAMTPREVVDSWYGGRLAGVRGAVKGHADHGARARGGAGFSGAAESSGRGAGARRAGEVGGGGECDLGGCGRARGCGDCGIGAEV